MRIPTIKTHKDCVRSFWNENPCGSRYQTSPEDFQNHAAARYSLEPYIREFAEFGAARDKRVLEIGVGMGADYLEWLKAGARATGIDLTLAGIETTRQRCRAYGFEADVRVGDAEDLPFSANTFDLVYSYGVLHHSSDTQRCIDETWRVLKPGGILKIMLYHHPSLTGLMLWARYGLLRRKSLRQSVRDHLESPETKTFTRNEIGRMLHSFRNIDIQQVFSPGDLLLQKPSSKFSGTLYKAIWKIYPRFLVRALCQRLGLFLLITAKKPRVHSEPDRVSPSVQHQSEE